MKNNLTLKERVKRRILFESKKLEPFLSDKLYLQIRFWLRVGYWPNLDHPRSFNEKLNWLKLHDKHPEYTIMVDKATAKDYVASIIGKEYIIPTIAIWDSIEEIDWELLPNQFVMKNTGDSGGIVVCKDKKNLNIEAAKAKLANGIEVDYYKYNKEYPYKEVRNRIIVETYMEDESGYELRDYKFFCFNGNARYFKVDYDRAVDHHANYYDTLGNLQEFGEVMCPPIIEKEISIPSNIDEMVNLANTLAREIKSPFLRVDFYNVHGNIYFGELTFFPASGMGKFIPEEWDYKIGELLKLPDHANT
jgi:hypothetical protein